MLAQCTSQFARLCPHDMEQKSALCSAPVRSSKTNTSWVQFNSQLTLNKYRWFLPTNLHGEGILFFHCKKCNGTLHWRKCAACTSIMLDTCLLPLSECSEDFTYLKRFSYIGSTSYATIVLCAYRQLPFNDQSILFTNDTYCLLLWQVSEDTGVDLTQVSFK